jgi:hypothetical protein
MKKITYTTAILMAMMTSSVFAHHPAADIVDPEIYAMIDENVADTPHADMVFDDMGNAMDQVGAGENGPSTDMAEVGIDTDAAMGSADAVDTIDLMETVASTIAD